jgi:hypothetical protein
MNHRLPATLLPPVLAAHREETPRSRRRPRVHRPSARRAEIAVRVVLNPLVVGDELLEATQFLAVALDLPRLLAPEAPTSIDDKTDPAIPLPVLWRR